MATWRVAVTTPPVFTGTGTLSSGSATVSSFVATYAPIVGQQVTGTGVPALTTVAAVGSGTFTMSAVATASGATALTIGAEPVSLAEAKAWARVTFPDEDETFNKLIRAAREEMEGAGLKRSLMLQARALYMTSFSGALISLPYPPIRSISSISYADQAGGMTTIDPASYRTSFDIESGGVQPIFGQVWPIAIPEVDSVKIAYTCGYGAYSSDIPATICVSLWKSIEEAYANRGTQKAGRYSSDPSWERFRQAESHGTYI